MKHDAEKETRLISWYLLISSECKHRWSRSSPLYSLSISALFKSLHIDLLMLDPTDEVLSIIFHGKIYILLSKNSINFGAKNSAGACAKKGQQLFCDNFFYNLLEIPSVNDLQFHKIKVCMPLGFCEYVNGFFLKLNTLVQHLWHNMFSVLIKLWQNIPLNSCGVWSHECREKSSPAILNNHIASAA